MPILSIPPPQIFVKCFILNFCYIFVRDFICFIKVFMKIVLKTFVFLYIFFPRVSLLFWCVFASHTAFLLQMRLNENQRAN